MAPRTCSATDVNETEQVALGRASIGTTALRETLQGGTAIFDVPSADQRAEQRRTLPLVLVIDLGY